MTITPEQEAALRMRVAELCGWKKDDHHEDGLAGGKATRLVTGWLYPNGLFRRQIPDYPNDLNAMHEAEKVLTTDQWRTYLGHVIGMLHIGSYLADIDFWVVSTVGLLRLRHTTATQLAIAFDRTLSKEPIL